MARDAIPAQEGQEVTILLNAVCVEGRFVEGRFYGQTFVAVPNYGSFSGTEKQISVRFPATMKASSPPADQLQASVGAQEGGGSHFSSMVESVSDAEKNGSPPEFTWADVKSVIIAKFDEVAKKYESERSVASLPPVPNVDNYTFDEYHTRIMELLNGFEDSPFTLGRICELLRDPRKHYDRGDKFLRAFEKCITVTSTKGGSDSTVNGTANGHTENGHANGDSHTETTTNGASEANGHASTNGASDDCKPATENTDAATTNEADSTVSASDEKMPDAAPVTAVDSAADTTTAAEDAAAAPSADIEAVSEGTAVEATESTEEKETLKRPNEDGEVDSVAKKIARIENGDMNGGTHSVAGEPEVEPLGEVELKKDIVETAASSTDETKATGEAGQEAAV